jgi:hypothetical protein
VIVVLQIINRADPRRPIKRLPRIPESHMPQGINVIALVKESERYIFLYDDDSPSALLQTFGRYASDPDLSFSWYDAAVLSQKVRKLRRDDAHTTVSEPSPRFGESSEEHHELS